MNGHPLWGTCLVHCQTSAFFCVRRVWFFAILVGEAAPSWAMEVPKACVWPTQSIAKCHEPSHMVPIANEWASVVGYMPGSLPNISLLLCQEGLVFCYFGG